MNFSERDEFYQRVFKDSAPERAGYNKTAFENSVREKLEFYRQVFKKAVHECFSSMVRLSNIFAGSRISGQEVRVVSRVSPTNGVKLTLRSFLDRAWFGFLGEKEWI